MITVLLQKNVKEKMADLRKNYGITSNKKTCCFSLILKLLSATKIREAWPLGNTGPR